MTNFTDAMIFDGTIRKTDDGDVVHARVARGGNVQDYLGSELGIDMAVVRVYRPEDEVFDREAIASYARKPITMGHPAGGVTQDTWKEHAVGEIDRDVMRDGEFVSVPLLFRDARAVKALKGDGGPRELSMGYEATVEMRDGVTPKGEAYDAVMTGFRMNHVAVVPRARGGKELRIGDGADQWGATPITDAKEHEMTLRKIMVDGLEVETTDAGAAAIKKLEAAVADKDRAEAEAKAAHDAALAAKDAEIATKDTEIADLKGKHLTDAQIDERVQSRAALIDSARKLAPKLATDGVSDADIRKAAVEAVYGADAIKDKSEAYIDAMFDIAAEKAPAQDSLRQFTQTAPKDAPVEDGGWGKALPMRKGA